MEAQPYDMKLDRHDTAIRAVIALYRHGRKGGNWNLLRELGIGREHEFELIAIIDSDENFREDASMIRLLGVCPWLLVAAERVLARYQAVTTVSRTEFYSRTKGRRAA